MRVVLKILAKRVSLHLMEIFLLDGLAIGELNRNGYM